MTDFAIPGPIDPPPRLLMGPGPISAYPSVLRAMSAPLVGQYDPFMTATMNETQELYRRVWGTRNEATLLVDGTSRAGIEAAMVSLIRPGDRVLVPVFGRFGHLLAEIAERAMAEVHTIEVPWGQVFPASVLDEALARVKPHLLALVQGDTSTTMNQPLDEVGALCAKHGALFYTDATASLGGNPFELDEWGVDAATAGLQKCLGGPSGSAPISLSPRAVEVIRSRAKVEAGIREPGDEDVARLHPLELLRPRHDPRVLGAAAPEPPHRGDVDALRRARVRPGAAARGARRRDRAAPPARRGDARGGRRARARASSAMSRTR